MNKFEIIVLSVPYREELVAHIYYNNLQWAEISHEEKELIVEFYCYPNKESWEFPLEEALSVLEKAKQRMIALGPKNPIPIDERYKDNT
ncbi:MAG: hypothetical protein K1060chlam2_00207 [Chlamydiae bacterium]|nr:hypothetical protein [Chlamydiota bacterium]